MTDNNEYISSDSEVEDETDYSRTKIYKLVNTENELYYIGSTVQYLDKRRIGHKHDAKRYANKYPALAYCKLNKIGWDNIDIELIEECSYIITREEKVKKEQEYLDKHMNELNCINTYRACATHEDKLQQKKASYQRCKETYKKYHEENCCTEDKKKEKQEYDKKRRQEAGKEICQICKGCYSSLRRKRHLQSQRHLNALE